MPETDTALAEALAVLEDRMGTVPALAALIAPWLEHRQQRLTHPGFVPIFAAPRWVPLALGSAVEDTLDRELTYSTLCGYLFIRLVDDVMDGQYEGAYRLVPALAFFDAEFQGIYRSRFPADHPFWHEFEAGWTGSFEAAEEDRAAMIDSETAFETIAARKLAATRVPVAAACYLCDGPLETWMEVCDRLCCLHQFADDLTDWQDDLASGRSSWLINEARRNASGSVAAWIISEGHTWALDTLDHMTRRVVDVGNKLGSPHVAEHARSFNAALQHWWQEQEPTFERLAALAEAMDPA